MNDEEFLAQLLEAFRQETDDHLRMISDGLQEMESGPDEDRAAELLKTMHREAHSLKGAARSVNRGDIEPVAQAMETVFARLKDGRLEPSAEIIDDLRSASRIVGALAEGREASDAPLIIDRLTAVAHGQAHSSDGADTASTPPTDSGEPKRPPLRKTEPDGGAFEPRPEQSHPRAESPHAPAEQRPPSTAEPYERVEPEPEVHLKADRSFDSRNVRIPLEKLDPLLRQVGEMVSIKLSTNQRAEDLVALQGILEEWKQHRSQQAPEAKTPAVRSASAESDDISAIRRYLESSRSYVQRLESELKKLVQSAESDARAYGSMVDDLLEDMMNVLMLPCSTLFDIFPKYARDAARSSGKEAGVEIIGGDIECDRRILDDLREPLTHLVRNAVDHGIEPPDERLRKGKAKRGTVTLSAERVSGNQIELIVSDDGAGIDVERVRKAAAESRSDAGRGAEKDDAVALVFRSDVSTSPMVTNISGRGLGLAVVREKVESLGGAVSVITLPDRGASFRLTLPVTLSTFRGVLVRVNEETFILPTANVERVVRLKTDTIKTVGARETIELDDRSLALVDLGEILELPDRKKESVRSGYISVLVLSAADTRVAFRVDEILQEQEVLVKALGRQLSRVRNVAGASVLGSGKLAPILNIPDLIKSAVTGASRRRLSLDEAASEAAETEESSAKSVLVVEDSITSRTLLKNILESSGYDVGISVDGIDAWNALANRRYDVVVSDVDMPRMDGFELTKKIREDDRMSELPVVLVTSLGSREDRERGIEVGADAYIVKGEFDQNRLLNMVERLI